jgi:acyl-homoserine-lactone acylase
MIAWCEESNLAMFSRLTLKHSIPPRYIGQPVRNGGSRGTYSGILDGSNRSLLWTGTFAFSDLPQAFDPPGGFVANSNNPPWTSTIPSTPTNDFTTFLAKAEAYVSPQFMDLRAQNGALLLQSKPALSVMDVLTAKESTHMLLADRVLPNLISAANSSGSSTAIAAANVLAGWDGNADATSPPGIRNGAVLFEAWWNIVFNTLNNNLTLPRDNTINFYSPHPPFGLNRDGTTGWQASNPLTTPNGLANAAAWVPALIAAAQFVQTTYGSLDVPWGAVHDVVLATHDSTFQKVIPFVPPAFLLEPQSGADDRFGPLRVLFPFPAGDGTFFPVSGDGYVQLVEFTPQGANAQALLGYGNASRPGSTHITDQLSFFQNKTLRTALRKRSDVVTSAVLRELVY